MKFKLDTRRLSMTASPPPDYARVLLTVLQAAELLELSEEEVRTRMNRKRLPFTHLDGVDYVSWPVLGYYLSRQEAMDRKEGA